MQIINRHSEAVSKLSHASRTSVRISEKRMSFSKAASVIFGMKGGMYIHFLQDNGLWSFYFNDDKTGFSLVKHDYKRNQDTLNVNCAAVISLFKQTTRYHSLPVSFYLKETSNRINGHKIIEIVTRKPI